MKAHSRPLFTGLVPVVPHTLAIGLGFLSALSISGSGAAEENLIQTGSFEEAEVGKAPPPPWYPWQPDGAKYTAAIEAGGKKGKNALKISGSGPFMVVNSANFPIKKGETFVFGCLARVEDAKVSYAGIKIDVLDANGKWLGSAPGIHLEKDAESWQRLAVISDFSAYPNADHFRVVVGLNGGGTAWFDDIQLRRVPSFERGLVLNGDMEVALEEAVPGWLINKPKEATCALLSVQEPVKNGKRALLLKGKGTWMSANSLPAEIDPTKRYRASAWIRVAKGHARVHISYWDGQKWLGASDGKDRIVKDEWRHVSVESDPGKFEKITHLHAAVVSDGPEVEVYIDDATLEPVEEE